MLHSLESVLDHQVRDQIAKFNLSCSNLSLFSISRVEFKRRNYVRLLAVRRNHVLRVKKLPFLGNVVFLSVKRLPS